MSAIHESDLSDVPASSWRRLCVSRLHYSVTWTTRGRAPVMTPNRAAVARTLLHGLAHKRGVRLESMAVLPDRVHLLLSLRPSDCAGSVVRELRGRSALLLLRELPELRVALGGHLLWSETYGISTVSPGALASRVNKMERMNGAHPAGSAESARCSSC